MHRILSVVAVVLSLTCVSGSYANPSVYEDDFSAGISEVHWEIIGLEPDVPWSVDAPADIEELRILKPADPGGPNRSIRAGLRTRFAVEGDFVLELDMAMPIWPHPGDGYNLARVYVYPNGSDVMAYALGRHNLRIGTGEIWERVHFRYNDGLIGDLETPATSARYRMWRVGDAMFASVTIADETTFLGSHSDGALAGPMQLYFLAEQGVRPTGYRSFSALEVHYDNVVITADSFLYPPLLADLNCDGVVSPADIDPFVMALTDPPAYIAQFPDCDFLLADLNGDGFVTAADIDPFVQSLISGL
jgi:hypothetical protein